jgi:NSS family neurotransmitter:Na+ symporter
MGFVLAASGSAVGLGNLWKFPYMTGANGGGAFVFFYLLFILLIGATVMIAEITLGRHTQLNAWGAYRKVKEKWAWVGGMGILAAFLIMSFYIVVGGWAIKYLLSSLTGALNIADAAALNNIFGAFVGQTLAPILYAALFMLITFSIVYGGIGKGIERASKIMMPTLFIFIIIIAVRSVTLPGAQEGISWFLVPDFSKINASVALAALGQVFFSLSLGMGCMVTYGSYLDKSSNIARSGFTIPLLDTVIAFVAGLAILPAVFAFGFEPAQGPGLMFVTLPAVFSQMPAGQIFAIIFFILVIFAALTSAISLLEVITSYLVDEKQLKRNLAAAIGALGIFILAIPASLSVGPWANIHIIGERGFFDSFDYLSSNIMLPLGGLLLCIFVGWVWGTDKAIKEITNDGSIKFALAGVWSFLVKFIAPVAIALVFASSLGLI